MRLTEFRLSSLLWLAVALVIAACSPPASSAPTAAAMDSGIQNRPERDASAASEAPEVELRSYAGTVTAAEFPTGLDWLNTEQPLSLAELRGKVVLLDFWTYGCINCMHNFPGLKQLEAEYADELVVIGVHSAKFENEGDTENIRQIILRYDLEHPVVNDNEFRVWSTWGVSAWPTLVLIDPRGNVVGAHSGEGVYPVLKPVIESLVNEFDSLDLVDRTPLGLRLEKEGIAGSVLSFPGKVLADPETGRLFISDTNNHRIIVADIDTGRIEAVFGSGERGYREATGTDAQFYNPQGMALSGETLYVADVDNHAIRTIDLSSGAVETLIGLGVQARSYPPAPGAAPNVELNSPWDLELDGETLYIAMAGSHQIWQLDLVTGQAGPLAGNGREGTLNAASLDSELAQPSAVVLGPKDRLYFSDSESSSIRWTDISGASPKVGTLAGSDKSLFQFGDLDGAGTGALLQHPLGIATDGELLYIADTYNSKIKTIDPESGMVTTLLGDKHGWQDGKNPLFYEPGGLDFVDGLLYVADTNNHAIRLIDLAAENTTTIVLNGIEAFMPSRDEFRGEILTLEAVTVSQGPGTIVLNVELPEGYKFNDLAPSKFELTVMDDVASLAADANRSVSGPVFPIEFQVEFVKGTGTIVADMALYYCEAETQNLCLFEQVRLNLPLKVGDGTRSVVELGYTISSPAIPNS